MDSVKLTVASLMAAATSLRTECLLLTHQRASCHTGLKTNFFLSVYFYYQSVEVKQTFVFCYNFSFVVHYFHNFHDQCYQTYSGLYY